METIAELRALPDGTVVRVRGPGVQVWTKRGDTLVHDRAAVPVGLFVGYLGSLKVQDPNRRVQPGDWLRSGRRWYLITSVIDDQVRYLQFVDEAPRDVQSGIS